VGPFAQWEQEQDGVAMIGSAPYSTPVYKQHLRDLLLSVQRFGMICCKNAHTSRVCVAPEDYRSVLVRRIAQNLVQLHGEAVQVANVQRAEVAVESIVEQCLVNAEVDWGMRLGASCGRANLGPCRPLRRRRTLLGVGERCCRIGCMRVRC